MEVALTKNGTQGVARIAGNFTFPDYVKFKDVLDLTKDENINSILIDVSGLEFVDSAALGMLMILRGDAQKTMKTVSISGMKGQVEKVLKMSKFDTLFNMVF